MKKYILLIDSSNDALDVFSNAMSQQSIESAYDCILVRNSDMAMKVLNRILPDFIFMNITAKIGLQALQQIRRLENLHRTPVYVFGDADLRHTIGTIRDAQVGRYISSDFDAEFLTHLLHHDVAIEGSVHVVCSN